MDMPIFLLVIGPSQLPFDPFIPEHLGNAFFFKTSFPFPTCGCSPDPVAQASPSSLKVGI